MNSGSFGLAVQTMKPNDRVLVLGHLAGIRNNDGWFAVDKIVGLHETFRIPDTNNVARSLGQLGAHGLVRRRSIGAEWSITPSGNERVGVLIGDFDFTSVNDALFHSPGADFMDTRYYVIPPTMAPPKWLPGIRRFLQTFPFEQNVFCMTRFPNGSADDPISETISVARQVFASHGLILHLASDRQIEDDLWGNVGAHMWSCQYGIGLVDALGGEPDRINSNMLIELGSMLTMGRRCAILKDGSAEKLPTDLSSQLYKSVDFSDSISVGKAINDWVLDDLSLAN